MDFREIIRRLDLQPHPEGGYYRETHRDEHQLPAEAAGRDGPRAASTAIYYLLGPGDFSAFHRLQSDEVFHFYAGDAVTMVQLRDGGAETTVLGPNVLAGEQPQVVVPANVWQALYLGGGGRFALMGCTVAPGFDFTDFEMGRRDDLLRTFPDDGDIIRQLTRPED